MGKAVSSALLYFTMGKILHRWSRRQATLLEQHNCVELHVSEVLGWLH